MLPGPLVPPAPVAVGGARRRIPGLVIAGVLACLVGVTGSVLWVGAASPYAFTRFPLAEGDRVLRVRDGGDYVVFLEGDADPGVTVGVTVLSDDGQVIPVSPSSDGAATYAVPGHRGRELARFVVPEGGSYLLRVRAAPDGGHGSSPDAVTVAVGRAVATTWVGHPAVGVLGPVVVLSGIGMLLWWRRRRTTPARARS